ncbi:unnamed protein product [Phytomonas sp. Hart1]|nr:unnamed protein product [Phytomonas sp. Hart1]|eukprot:CCW71751.1 unnamed protein product [Phytomonas sp. isolate Hart1]
MSTEAVKKRLLLSTSVLNIPLDRTPREAKVNDVCAAAKLLRRRLLREHTFVVEKIQQLRQRQVYDDETDDGEDEEITYKKESVSHENPNSSSSYNPDLCAKQTYRHEFMLLADLQVAEKNVIPVLLAHGIKFVENLLPQLLKLLIALLLPVPRFSDQESQQKDLLTRIKVRCGTDQFFALMVQIVADIAMKRASGKASQSDFSLLNIVLTTISYLLEGHPRDISTVAGSFCRTQGVELLLVIVNQNYAKVKPSSVENMETTCPPPVSEETNNNPHNIKIHDSSNSNTVNKLDLVVGHEIESISEDMSSTGQKVVVLNEDSTSEDNETGEDFITKESSALARQFEQRVKDYFESEQQLWKWNVLVIKSLSSVLSCVSPIEMAQLSISNNLASSSLSLSERQNIPFRGNEQLKACKQENDKWHCIARGRNGAMNSSSILVRPDPKRAFLGVKQSEDDHGDAKQRVGGRAIGSVSTLLSTKRKDPLEAMKDIDFRKRGRFVSGMFQGATPFSDIPLPTKIQLSQQIRSFLCFGFEPLSVMTWTRLEGVIQNVDQSTKEYKEMIAAYRNSDEVTEITSPFEASVYESFSNVLGYVKTSTSFLAYIRETARIMKHDNIGFTSSPFQQQWQSVSSIISLGHLEGGFSMLRSFLQCKDLRQRLDMIVVVHYLSEMLLVLTLLLEGDLIQDAAVAVAAHALVSSILYKEINIKTFFDLIGLCTGNRKLSLAHAQAISLFMYAVFQLMDQCSYKGRLLLMKRPAPNHRQKDTDPVGLDSAAQTKLQNTQEVIPLGAASMTADTTKSNVSGISDQIPELQTELREIGDDNGVNSPHWKTLAQLDNEFVDNDKVSDPLKATAPIYVANDNDKAEAVEYLPINEAMTHPINGMSNDDGVDVTAREMSCALSEAHPASVASSSIITSEREVSTRSYFHRIATPKHMNIIKVTLQHWRLNDADVNLGLTYLIKKLLEEGCEGAFYNVSFLLIIRDVIVNGKRSHRPLYDVCDELAYFFFNPNFAKVADERTRTLLNVNELPMVSGSQSFLGFEVSLRCARSLFNYNPTDYKILEEKAIPAMMDYTVLELPEWSSSHDNVDDPGLERQNSTTTINFNSVHGNSTTLVGREETLTQEHNEEYVGREGEEKTRKREREQSEIEWQTVGVSENSGPKWNQTEEKKQGMDNADREANENDIVVS